MKVQIKVVPTILSVAPLHRTELNEGSDQGGRDGILRRSRKRSAGIAATPEGGSGALFNVEAGTSAAMRVGSRGGL